MHKMGTHSPAALFWKFTKWLKRPFNDVSSTRMLRLIRSSKCEINGPTHPLVDVGRSNFIPWNVDFGKLSLKIAYWIYLSKSSNSSHCARNERRSQGKLQTKYTWESHLLIGSCDVFVMLSWHNTSTGVLRKNHTRVASKVTTTNYISIERLWTADFEQKYPLCMQRLL